MTKLHLLQLSKLMIKNLDTNLKMCEGVHSFSKLIWKDFKVKNLKTAALFSQMLRTAAAPTPQSPLWHRHPDGIPLTSSRLEICWPHLVNARPPTKRNRPSLTTFFCASESRVSAPSLFSSNSQLAQLVLGGTWVLWQEHGMD